MDSRTQERVEQWSSRPFVGGYDELTDLATSDFSGAITAAGTWVFMLNGRIIGVVDGDIEDFETASGTQYDAPHPSLPLLCSMTARGGETRAKYYTNETPLREVDRTLQEGSFTGYIELSENVLSGDYYAVYYGGRRMAAAYIGNANRLLTGDEAFDRADDEVGIYEVITVDVEVTDVPGATADTERDGTDASAESTATTADTDADVSATETDSTESVTALGSGREDEDDTALTELGSESDDGETSGDDAVESITALGSGREDEDDTAITALGSGSDDGETSDDDADVSTTALDSASEDDQDETQASIESIADVVSSSEVSADDDTATDTADTSPLTDEIDLTDGPSGITTTDESKPEPRSPGITDIDPEDPTPIGGSEADTSSEPTSPDSKGVSEQPADEPERETETAPADRESAESTVEFTEPATDRSLAGADPAEIEAAAKALDENDISWTDEETGPLAAADSSDSNSAADVGPTAEADAGGPESQRTEEAQWRSARTIPSIDPDNSETPDSPPAEKQSASQDGARSAAETTANSTDQSAAEGAPDDGRQSERAETRQQSERAGTEQRSTASTAELDRVRAESQQRIEELTERLERATTQRDTLREKAVALKEERDRFRATNEELTATIEQLQSRIDELEGELAQARAAAAEATDTQSEADADDAGVDASTELQPTRALSDTNLFIRYGSKSQPTLDTAHDDQADRDEVARNLRLEHHTGFDASDVAVDGTPYETYLGSTMAYRFVEWLTETVLYEVRDTGHASALSDLYDGIPRIDRTELHASVSLVEDDTEDVPDEVTFDVVAYDKMGNPLLVANLNDSRSPATREMLEAMEESASAVKANYPSLAAAMVVTSSYFEPGALEVADAATSNGLLSRGSKLSYVNLSRKTGYHLCLVESRSEGFHMTVPEL